MADHERERHVDQREPGLVGELRQRVGRLELALVLRQAHVEAAGDALGAARLRRVGALAPLAREPAARQRAPGHHAHAVAAAHRQHVALDPAHEQRVGRLLGHEALAPAPLRRPLRLHDLVRREGGAAEVEDLALAHQVGEGAERLVDVGVRVGAVDLVEVDVVGAQAAQAVLDLADDPAARVAAHVRVVAHRRVDLGGQHHVVAPAGQRLADDLLGLAGRVDVGGVDEVDPRVERAVDDPDRVVVVGVAPVAEHHRAEAQGVTLTPVAPRVRCSTPDRLLTRLSQAAA